LTVSELGSIRPEFVLALSSTCLHMVCCLGTPLLLKVVACCAIVWCFCSFLSTVQLSSLMVPSLLPLCRPLRVILSVCLQVLPVNDTCVYNMWWDSYPYSSLSVHALHPQYLALRATLDDLPGARMPRDIAAAIEAARVSSSADCL
jgi:4-alpha-glucanotransferase